MISFFVLRFLLVLPLLLGSCVLDAGCLSYGEARLSQPRPLPENEIGAWVADLDDRMTGTCR